MKISPELGNIYIDMLEICSERTEDNIHLQRIVEEMSYLVERVNILKKLHLIDTLISCIDHKLIILIDEYQQQIRVEARPLHCYFPMEGSFRVKGNFFAINKDFDLCNDDYLVIARKCLDCLEDIFTKFFKDTFNDLKVYNIDTNQKINIWARVGSIVLGEPVEKLECILDTHIRNEIFQRVFGTSYVHHISKDKDIELKDRLTKQLQNSNFGVGQLTDYVNTNIEITKQVINNMHVYKKEENNMPPKSYYNYMFTEPSQAVKDKGRHRLIQSMGMMLGIRDVKFNDPATIVFWDDGTKTVVKCQEGDTFDPEKGLAMAIVKKQCGHNNGYFNRIFQKWCPEPEEDEPLDNLIDSLKNLSSALKAIPGDTIEDNVETKEFTKANDGYDDITWLTRRSYDRA